MAYMTHMCLLDKWFNAMTLHEMFFQVYNIVNLGRAVQRVTARR